MDYKLIRSRRRTLSVEVGGKGVIVRSPFFVSETYINRFISEKSEWIISKLKQNSEREKGVSPGEVYYLGKKRKLRYGPVPEINEQAITLVIKGNSLAEKRAALLKLLSETTKELVKFYLRKYTTFSFGSVIYKKYSSKWGSCSPQNHLAFNVKLAMCPEAVIEYVVVHELCHTEVKSHSRHFWQEVEKILPDYKKSRKWLRDHRWSL